jgi:hypothetical protein
MLGCGSEGKGGMAGRGEAIDGGQLVDGLDRAWAAWPAGDGPRATRRPGPSRSESRASVLKAQVSPRAGEPPIPDPATVSSASLAPPHPPPRIFPECRRTGPCAGRCAGPARRPTPPRPAPRPQVAATAAATPRAPRPAPPISGPLYAGRRRSAPALARLAGPRWGGQ